MRFYFLDSDYADAADSFFLDVSVILSADRRAKSKDLPITLSFHKLHMRCFDYALLRST